MISRRLTRVNELIRREIAEALFRLMTENRFDLSAVTVTHVLTSANLRQARVLVSIRDHKDERGTMLSMLRQHRVELQELINRNLGLKYTPRLSFELDTSLERGDQVLNLLNAMGGDPDDGAEGDPGAAEDDSTAERPPSP